MKSHRTTLDLTVREMEKKVGVSYSTISRVENGFCPDGPTLAKILKWLLDQGSNDIKHNHTTAIEGIDGKVFYQLLAEIASKR